MSTLFRWIHVTDIHVGHGDAEQGWDQKLVLAKLQQDVASVVARGMAPIDAILVTGDVAFSGNGRKTTEYADAKDWLLQLARAARVDAGAIFVVPGNHDVNRAADDDSDVRRLVRNLRRGDEKLDVALADAKERDRLARRQEAYLAFAADFAPACLGRPRPPAERLFWVHRLEKRGLRLRLVGLNTALLAQGNDDRGYLRLGNEQIHRALFEEPLADGEMVIALGHHPFCGGWLADEKEADKWLRNNAHVHLSGPVHEADSEEVRAGSGGHFVRVVAGAAYGSADPNAPMQHGYNLGEVVHEGGAIRLRVYPRIWSPKSTDFRLDNQNTKRDCDYAEHDLPRVKLAPVEEPEKKCVPEVAAPEHAEADRRAETGGNDGTKKGRTREPPVNEEKAGAGRQRTEGATTTALPEEPPGAQTEKPTKPEKPPVAKPKKPPIAKPVPSRGAVYAGGASMLFAIATFVWKVVLPQINGDKPTPLTVAPGTKTCTKDVVVPCGNGGLRKVGCFQRMRVQAMSCEPIVATGGSCNPGSASWHPCDTGGYSYASCVTVGGDGQWLVQPTCLPLSE